MCVWVVARLPQRKKSTFFEIFSSLRVFFGDPPLIFFSKNIDFSLWGKHCIVLPKWTFFHILAHCTVTCVLTTKAKLGEIYDGFLCILRIANATKWEQLDMFLPFLVQWAKTRKNVHFARTMHCLPERLKSICFDFFWVEGPGVKI